MDEDIVTRLRDNCACSGTEQFGYTCTSCTAADEIERLRILAQSDIYFGQLKEDEIEYLREENNKASALIAKLAELLLPYSMLMNKSEQELLIKAVRGE